MLKNKDKNKTNVMRILDKSSITYTPHRYDHKNGAIDGVSVASKLGQNPGQVFKTLICRGHGGDFFVFVIPVNAELDLKKAARAAGEKSVEMIHVAEIRKVTGYERGGCSPIGMKKPFPTIIDASCETHPTIMVSAGKTGFQIEINPEDLVSLIGAETAKIQK